VEVIEALPRVLGTVDEPIAALAQAELERHAMLRLGTRLEIRKKFPFDNSLEIKVRNRPPVTLSAQVAKNVLVKDDESLAERR